MPVAVPISDPVYDEVSNPQLGLYEELPPTANSVRRGKGAEPLYEDVAAVTPGGLTQSSRPDPVPCNRSDIELDPKSAEASWLLTGLERVRPAALFFFF